MVVLQRNEVRRHQFVLFLTIILSVMHFNCRLFSIFPERLKRYSLVLDRWGCCRSCRIISVGIAALRACRNAARFCLFRTKTEIVIATNALHEGFKLRFLRDILGENDYRLQRRGSAALEELEADGFYATLYIRNVRKAHHAAALHDDLRRCFLSPTATIDGNITIRRTPPSLRSRSVKCRRLTSWKSST